ncbi:AAA family ATPase [Rhizobium leguminosarum]|uniref:AAA family ATPase n=1 Tax=Rhizobium leguminosarum TaxID=384 RepID=UPI001030E26B|nr:AAA family ATPase [Rhizobium leguminosarum]TAY87720.1 hypothetical protein ELH83_07740 [Rhizobium leguminosarum]
MDVDRLERIAENDSVFLVGPNGAGKSRTLRKICEHFAKRSGETLVAISNTPYARLPERIQFSNYVHIKISASTTKSLLRQLLADALDSDSYALISMREVLEYTDYAPVLRIRIWQHSRPGPVDGPSASGQGFVYPYAGDEHVVLAETIDRWLGYHDIPLDDSSAFLSRFQQIARVVVLQHDINKTLRSLDERPISISFGLYKKKDGLSIPLIAASSGELTLLTTAMFILSKRSSLSRIFIDEPENSLHPQWQVKYFDFITSLVRRENIRFYFATHSAVLANSALNSPYKVRIIRCDGDRYDEVKFDRDSDESIEELLWEAFDTVTPASSFISETISKLVWDVREGKISKDQALQSIQTYSISSFSEQQKEFFEACKQLIASID